MPRWPAAWLGCLLLGACKPPPPSVAPSEYEGSEPLNPKHEGQLVYRSYGHHHPTCFVLADDGQTEDVQCPKGALQTLERCQSGTLYRSNEQDCVCVSLSGDPPPARVACH